MITTAIINLGYAAISFLIGLLPLSVGLPDEVHEAATLIGAYLDMLDPALPVTTLFSCLVLYVSVQIGIFGFRTFRWVMSHLPQVGGNF